MLEVVCAVCGEQWEVPAELVGESDKCPQCGTVVKVGPPRTPAARGPGRTRRGGNALATVVGSALLGVATLLILIAASMAMEAERYAADEFEELLASAQQATAAAVGVGGLTSAGLGAAVLLLGRIETHLADLRWR